MSARNSVVFPSLVAVVAIAMGASIAFAQTTVASREIVVDAKAASSTGARCDAVALNQVAEPYSYRDDRGWPPQVQYRYPYRYGIARRVYRPYRAYYYAPAYRYPPGVYPRTPDMMYYGPAVKVYQSPWLYSR